MNFSKTEFTKEQFLELPEFQTVREAPVKTPFLLSSPITIPQEEGDKIEFRKVETSRYSRQKEFLLGLIEQVQKMNPKDFDEAVKNAGNLKVFYWSKHNDGNVSELGGFISMKKILESMKPTIDLNGILPPEDLSKITFEHIQKIGD